MEILFWILLLVFQFQPACLAENMPVSRIFVVADYAKSSDTVKYPLKPYKKYSFDYSKKAPDSSRELLTIQVSTDAFVPRTDIKYKLILPPNMIGALNRYDSEFEIYQAHNFGEWEKGFYNYKNLSYEKGYRCFETPSAVVGDFNGDKVPDAALLGQTKLYSSLIVLLSDINGYAVFEIYKYDFRPTLSKQEYLDLMKKKGIQGESLSLLPTGRKIKAEPAYNRPGIKLKNDAFEYGGEKGSTLYVYENGKFVEYIMSD